MMRRLSCAWSREGGNTSPRYVVTDAPRFMVQSTEEVEQAAQSPSYSYNLIASTMLRAPILDKMIEASPELEDEMKDALSVALVLYVSIVRKFYSSSMDAWDHSCLHSRVAIAVACGMAMKLVMDQSPVSTCYCLGGLVKSHELGMSLDKLMDYLTDYELLVMNNIKLRDCLNNPHAICLCFLRESHSQGVIPYNLATNAERVSLFFSFNATRFLEKYLEESVVGHAGAALGILSVKCADFPHFKESSRLKLADEAAYTLALRMATDMQKLSASATQAPLFGRFVDTDAWQHVATKPRSIVLIKQNVNQDMSVLFPDRKE